MVTGSYFGPAFAPSEYYVVVSGTKAGVPFTKFLLDPNDTISVTDFSGNWGIGSYEGTAGWSSVNAMIHAPEQNVKGYINLAKSTGPPAWGCGPDTGTNMESLITPSSSAAEVKMFKGTSWAHFASGNAHVNFDVDGVELDFTGPFESETSYSPPYQEIYSRFIYVFTTIGPYDIAVWHVAPPGEPTKYATVGYLAENNHLIVNRCNTVNTNGIDSTTITTIGSFSVTGSSLEIAGSLTIDFTDKYGKHFVFAIDTLKATGASFPTGNTIIGQATATGGIAGGHQCNGSALVLYYSAPGGEYKDINPL